VFALCLVAPQSLIGISFNLAVDLAVFTGDQIKEAAQTTIEP
jgi:hypothetical protein